MSGSQIKVDLLGLNLKTAALIDATVVALCSTGASFMDIDKTLASKLLKNT